MESRVVLSILFWPKFLLHLFSSLAFSKKAFGTRMSTRNCFILVIHNESSTVYSMTHTVWVMSKAITELFPSGYSGAMHLLDELFTWSCKSVCNYWFKRINSCRFCFSISNSRRSFRGSIHATSILAPRNDSFPFHTRWCRGMTSYRMTHSVWLIF